MSLKRKAGLICILLAVLTWLVFGQTLRHDFVNYDDPSYVYENPKVNEGLTFAGAARAFTHIHARNWHPLTTLSHMLDCQLFGLQAGGHHFTNVLLHSVIVVLLFVVFVVPVLFIVLFGDWSSPSPSRDQGRRGVNESE